MAHPRFIKMRSDLINEDICVFITTVGVCFVAQRDRIDTNFIFYRDAIKSLFCGSRFQTDIYVDLNV